MSRLLGLLRTVVFAQTVGAGCLGTAYVTAYTGAEPDLRARHRRRARQRDGPGAGPRGGRADTDEDQKAYVAQVASALLTWSVLILLPVTVAIVALARPIAELLIPANPNAACARPAMLGTTTDLIVAFAPQIMLYGISVVLTGLLQAYRKFTGPTLAPGHRQPGDDHRLPGLRLARQEPPDDQDAAGGAAGAVHRHHDEHRHAGAGGAAADLAAAAAAAADAAVPARRHRPGGRPGAGRAA